MKATQQTQQTFTPVILTLETQNEVDAIFAVLNHITLSSCLDLYGAYACLREFRSKEYTKYQNLICDFNKPL